MTGVGERLMAVISERTFDHRLDLRESQSKGMVIHSSQEFFAMAILLDEVKKIWFQCNQSEVESLRISTNDQVHRCAISYVPQKVDIGALMIQASNDGPRSPVINTFFLCSVMIGGSGQEQAARENNSHATPRRFANVKISPRRIE